MIKIMEANGFNPPYKDDPTWGNQVITLHYKDFPVYYKTGEDDGRYLETDIEFEVTQREIYDCLINEILDLNNLPNNVIKYLNQYGYTLEELIEDESESPDFFEDQILNYFEDEVERAVEFDKKELIKDLTYNKVKDLGMYEPI